MLQLACRLGPDTIDQRFAAHAPINRCMGDAYFYCIDRPSYDEISNPMIKEKWLNYAIATLKSCHSGFGSISDIADNVGGSASYIAKVIASLRSAHIIDKNYELTKQASQITVREIVESSGLCRPTKEISSKVLKIILKALEIPITQIW